MPLPLFLGLIATVIAAAGASIALVFMAGMPMIWLAIAAPILALLVRGLAWR